MSQHLELNRPGLEICETCPIKECETCPLSLAYNLGKRSTLLKEEMDSLIRKMEDSRYTITDVLEIVHDVTSGI